MTQSQWETLVRVVKGEPVEPIPVGFIVDSPWLPAWAGMSMLDYFASEEHWLDAHSKAAETFPDVIFLPGFWSEYGMCTEPSAFGAKCVWYENDFPFAGKVLNDIAEARRITPPDPRTDGLLPFVIARLRHMQQRIRKSGHFIRFAVARGPLNIASFFMGTTEFLTALRTDPDGVHALLKTITTFLEDWLQYQKECFPTIDGILLLDDIVGFCGEDDFREFALPYLKQAFAAFNASIRFFHNDAEGTVTARHCTDIGINLFNFSFQHSIAEMRELTNYQVALLGNIPPRDILALGTPNMVRQAVIDSVRGVSDTRRIILSCGGGMPPDVSSDNIHAFVAGRDALTANPPA